MDDILSGEPLDGTYRIEQLLGEGGMGAVYRAIHLGTTRTVAVKIIHPRFSRDQQFVERFRRETEAAGRLRHPNVVDVTDFGFAATPGGQVAYLVMEYLDGHSLAYALEQEKRLSIGSAVDILEQVCSAVEEAHHLGIVHRDLKPDNTWLEPNRRGGFTVKVLDFGLAKLSSGQPDASSSRPWQPGPEGVTGAFPAADSGVLTQAGSVTGTPLYMSPEQCQGGEVGPASDIYSLGVVAYRMLAGEPPFTGGSMELIKHHCETEAPNLRARSPDVPDRLSALVRSALAKEPAARPLSATGYGSALRASAEGSGALLRHAVSLYSEHFPSFFRLSLLANGPLIMERLSVGATLRRARSLIRRVWNTAIVIAILQFTLPALAWIAAADFDFALRLDDNWRPREVRFGFSMSTGSLVYQLLNVVVTPLTGIMTAELYLKARHAGGERIDHLAP